VQKLNSFHNNRLVILVVQLLWALTTSDYLLAANQNSKAKEPAVRSYITLYPGSGGACAASKKNADAKNNHDKRRIQATFRDGSYNVTKDFAPGESRTVGFCNYGKLKLVSAKYIN
jgi:hypothetical protein